MGMDVYGVKPTSPQGEYFRNSVWSWRPLADYVCEVAPSITSRCEYWQTNDGAGLDAEDSKELASVLRGELESGRTWKYSQDRQKEHSELPDEICTICAGTGKRLKPPAIGAGDMPCNGCQSIGHIRPSATWYSFSESNVRNFVEFLEDCGGFTIT